MVSARLLLCCVGLGILMAACSGTPAAPSTPTVPVTPPPSGASFGSTRTPTTVPVATLIVASRPSPSAVPGPTSEIRAPGVQTETGALASQFESGVNEGDVDRVMTLFAPDAEVKVPPDRYVGRLQIRNWVTYLAENHFASEPGFRSVVADHASWPAEIRSDYLDKIGLPSLSGTASLVAKGGLIQSYTFVLTEDSAHRHRAAQLAATEVLQDPIIVGQDAANVYGTTDVFHDSSGKLVSYRDVLTAEPGSGPYYDLGGQPIVVRSGF